MATIAAIATIATFPHRFGVSSQQTDAKSRRCKSKLTTNNTANDADWRRSRRDENVTGAIGVIGPPPLVRSAPRAGWPAISFWTGTHEKRQSHNRMQRGTGPVPLRKSLLHRGTLCFFTRSRKGGIYLSSLMSSRLGHRNRSRVPLEAVLVSRAPT